MKTPIIIRAIASGGKFIGAMVGGFSATLYIPGLPAINAASGDQPDNGSSGNTFNLMQQPRLRGTPLPTNSDTQELPGQPAASIHLEVDIAAPVLAKLSVTGPNGFGDQQATTTITSWILPGIGWTGGPVSTNGMTVELPGLLIQNAKASATGGTLTVSAQVTMMCGCKIIDNNGIWLSTDFSVVAEPIDAKGNTLGSLSMGYVPYTSSGSTPSLFQYSGPLPAGTAQVRIKAWQLSTANVGCVTVALGA